MSALSNLIALTLYNCPISKRNGYRHHTVNTLWSLKALDNYILSDEEIIEGADFKESPFHSFSPQLRINLNPSDKSIQSLSKLINRINYTVKHCSPVHIIQRQVNTFPEAI